MSYVRIRFRACAFAMVALFLAATVPAHAAPSAALGYEPKYGPDFEHFDYVNPDSPFGGELILPAFGSFNSLNPFLLKGEAAANLELLVFETLMAQSMDEPFSVYPLLAEDIELAEDRLSVTFTLNADARFSDGSPVTAEDVKFSFDTLKSKAAHPQYRYYWADIERAVVVDRRTVRFEFKKVNPELHLIAASLPIFSRDWIGDRDFDDVVFESPIASGPYVIQSLDLGRELTLERNPDYWGEDLPSRRGMFNFRTVTFKYYKDLTVMREGFKAGEFDFMFENNSKQWALQYDGEKFDKGLLVKDELEHSNNAGMQGFVFNTRREIFKDWRVRRAITLAMDFEWSNEMLFYGQYERCYSYFTNTELAASGLPEGEELALLEKYRDQLPKRVFTEPWKPPNSEPPGSLRENLVKALQLLREAGWEFRDGAMRDEAGRPLTFSVMLAQEGFERIFAPFARNLRRLGIEINYRTVDTALYQRRANSREFDMMVAVLPQSQSPGNELFSMFHSSSADQEGSNNIIGIDDPVVDALVEEIVYAEDRDALVTAAHALDRVLLHSEYVVPNWFIDVHRVAYWDKFFFPQTLPLYYQPFDWLLMSWWIKPMDIEPLES